MPQELKFGSPKKIKAYLLAAKELPLPELGETAFWLALRFNPHWWMKKMYNQVIPFLQTTRALTVFYQDLHSGLGASGDESIEYGTILLVNRVWYHYRFGYERQNGIRESFLRVSLARVVNLVADNNLGYWSRYEQIVGPYDHAEMEKEIAEIREKQPSNFRSEILRIKEHYPQIPADRYRR